jgi:cell wall-associated NlpC family hydrolase
VRRIETQRQQWPHRVADLSGGAPDSSGNPTVTGTEGMSALEAGTALGVGSARDQKAESIAQSAAGKPYEYGGSGPGSTNDKGQPASSWDCSGLVGDMYSATMGLDPNAKQTSDSSGTRFNTTSDMAAMGFERGSQPGTFNMGLNPSEGSAGHMSVELPSGNRAESSGSGGVESGSGARQITDSPYTQQWHLPDATQNVVNQMTSPSDAGSSAANKS